MTLYLRKLFATQNLLLSGVKRFLPQILIAVAVSSVLAYGYTSVILQNSSLNTPKVTWLTKPLVITFNANSLFGSAGDLFTCSPSTQLVVDRPISSSPNILAISTNPTSFASCTSAAQSITVTGTCLVPPAQCRGSYNGVIQTRQPATYRNLADPLQVSINVT